MAGPAAARPLRGKSFYLDVPSGRSARELAEAIRHLGGVTESFLSKEVSYVVSSSKEAKRDKAKTRTEKWSNATSEGAKAKSPVPSASKGNYTRPHQKPPDTVLISRGKELLQKAMKNQDACSGNGILANARLWGVQIVHIDEMLSYAQQLLHAISGARKRSQKTEAKCLASGSKVRKGKLKPPFLKVEDQSRRFRPFHHQFKSFPDLNFLAPKSSSPFEPLKSLSNSCRARDVEGCPMRSEGGKSPQSTPVTVPKRKRGFCECCQETFEELQKHLQSPQHKRFALDDSQYAPVDHVISQLTNNFVEQSAKVPWSCLTDEHLKPQAQVTRGNEMLIAELGKESQQAPVELFTDAKTDPGLKMKECSAHLPNNRVSNLREGRELSENCSPGLPAGAGLTRGVCAVQGTTEGSVVGDADSSVAPSLGQETYVETAQVRTAIAVYEVQTKKEVLGPVSHLLQVLPITRKRQLSSRQSAQVGKKPRLELGGALSRYEQTSQVDGGMGVQDAGHVPELDLPSVAQAGSLPLSTELSTRPRSSPALELCLCGDPGDPATQRASLGAASVGFDPPGMAAASTVSQCGWSRADVSSHGKQLGEEEESTPLSVDGHDWECRTSTVSKTSCPTGQLPSQKLPVAEAGCCHSLCDRAAEKVAPELCDLPGHSKELTPGPGLPLPHNTQADLDFRTAAESDWDIQLLSMLTGVQGSRILPVDRHLLRRTCVSVRDSGYESQLPSVLKRKSELDWAGKDDRSCRNCCTETEGASFPISETSLGSWTS
ncbi:protein DBF4 homolog B isoform X2 [Dromaius novaehollandiae]|uniref:protein DBF4 homolog B isoform X2 n=1 Tax=Dromaius novaehollandiae TaxID=8790 RepID=UPI00311FCBA6